LRKVGLDIAKEHESHYSAEELKLILRSSRADANFTTEEWRGLAQALDFRDLEVSDLMRPFNEAVTISAADDVDKSLDRIAERHFTRYPYVERDGSVRGVVNVKDLFSEQRNVGPLKDIGKLIRPVVIVPSNFPATALFRQFRKGAPHFAVISSGERPVGFVTIDDLLAAPLGEIRDEFRKTETQWSKLDDGSLIGKGSLPIFTLERVLGIDVAESEVGSVGGLVYQQLRNVPREGQRISFERFDVVVTQMEGPRIATVRIIPKEEISPV
jgi:CBS domain containing-hemolysin-like protein